MVQNRRTQGKVTINGSPASGLKIKVFDQDYTFGVPVFSSLLGTGATNSSGNYSISYSPDKYGAFWTDEDRVELTPGSIFPPRLPTYGPAKPDLYIEVYDGGTILKKSSVNKNVSSEAFTINIDIRESEAHADTLYSFTELPPEEVAVLFPCNAEMHWPGYQTKYFSLKIDGRDVIIQLWKGYCPSYMPGMVGGVGAEVGIYHKDWQPAMWWPDYQHKKQISFTLINPITNNAFLTAEPKLCWWRHKWMTESSYADYMLHNKVPGSPAEYILKYTIAGHDYIWDKD
jgi:hypothetical protein